MMRVMLTCSDQDEAVVPGRAVEEGRCGDHDRGVPNDPAAGI